MAEALYRKYRPQVFEDVVGQEPIERTLKNAIAQDKVSHAYLFTGPRGTGKTTTARLLAKALLCEKGPTPDPDGACEDCHLIAEGAHPDVYELDAASRTGVENVREEIISRVSFAPTRGRYKVYIIDEVHMLSTAAFNALLKTLEEPPGHVVFVLCTTDPQKVPETIHSRCQRFDFRRIAPESMVSRLGAICIAEDVEFEGEALDLIAHRAEGGLRNALTSLEQIIAFENGKVTLAGAERLLGSIDSNDMAEIIAYVGKRDIANCFRWTAAYVETGADLAQFVRDMAEHVRNLYVMSLVGDDVELDVGETSRRELIGELQWFGPDRLARLLGVLGDLSAELKTSSNPRLAFEIALTRMVRPDSDLTLEALAERVEALESGYSAVAHVLPGEPLHLGVEAANAGEVYSDLAQFDAPEPRRAVERREDARPVLSAQGVSSERLQSEAIEQAWQPLQQSNADAQQPVQRASYSTGAAAQSRAQGQVADYLAPELPQRDQADEGQVRPVSQAAQEPARVGQASAYDQTAQKASAGTGAGLSAFANPAALQRIWQAALSALKKQKQAYGVLFMNTKVRFDAEDGMLKVVFPDESAFAFNAVQKPDVQDALSASLEHAAGCSVPFSYEKAGAVGATAAGASASRASRPASHVQSQQPTPEPAVQPISEPVAQSVPGPAMQGASAAMAPMAQQAQSPAPAEQSMQQAADQQPAPSAAAAAQQPAPSPALSDQQQASPPAAGQHMQPVADQQSAQQEGQRYEQQPVQQRAPQTGVQPAAAQADPYEQPPWDVVPYEDAPYDEAPYEPVPYEELGGGCEQTQPVSADAATGASPAAPNLTPEGAIAEDPADVEAMLQAGFGGGVIFSEVE